MASLGHVAVGLLAARVGCAPGRRLVAGMALLGALSLLPDLDVIAFALRIPYGAPFGHRGASHSIAAALLFALLFAPLLRPLCRGGLHSFGAAYGLCALVLVSHGLLDALTDGGLGAALLYPLSPRRYFAPWRPLPVAPIGARLLSQRGLSVMATELLYFLPLWLYALWPRRAQQRNGSDARGGAGGGAAPPAPSRRSQRKDSPI